MGFVAIGVRFSTTVTMQVRRKRTDKQRQGGKTKRKDNSHLGFTFTSCFLCVMFCTEAWYNLGVALVSHTYPTLLPSLIHSNLFGLFLV